MPELLLFDELFIEYVQTFYFKHPADSFGVDELVENFPAFYKDTSMVTGAIHILLMRGMLEQVPLITNSQGKNIDEWKAKKTAIETLERNREIEQETREVDLTLKTLGAKNFNVPRNLSIGSIVISLLALIATVVNLIITYNKKHEQVFPCTQTEIKLHK